MRDNHWASGPTSVWRAPTGALFVVILLVNCTSSTEPLNRVRLEAVTPARIEAISGNNQVAAAGTVLSQPLLVRVTDVFGNPIRGATVTFAVVSGGGSVDGGTAATDAAGLASGTWRLGSITGVQQVRAQADTAQTEFTASACEASSCPQIVFVRDGQIHRLNLADGASQQLTTTGRNAYPAWSPDGRRIAFVRLGEGGTADIYLMDADGSDVVRRTVGADFHSPAWSPDGRTLAVARGFVYYADVYLLSADDDGAGAVHVASMATRPAWSPDGNRIAFVSLSGDDGYNELQVMLADGSAVSSLTLRDSGSIDRPTWSPDGKWVAFSKCLLGECDVHVARSDGSDASAPKRLTTVQNATGPTWSPDGTRIAFTLQSHTGQVYTPAIAYVAADGRGDPVPIVSPGYGPAWRP